jgi:hypothetical protein
VRHQRSCGQPLVIRKSQPPYELFFALAAIIAITVGYGFLVRNRTAQPGNALGLTLGTAGFLLMLATQTLYTLRKGTMRFPWGRMSFWLRLHIFTGLVGPYLFLLHSAWRFQGLAGVLMLTTLVVVISGLIGRYIYTAVPRNLEGVEVAISDLEEQLAQTNQQLSERGIAPFETLADEIPIRGWFLVLGRHLLLWRQKRALRHLLRHLDATDRPPAARVLELLTERHRLLMQIHSMEAARRMLAIWHTFHVPLTGAMFALAFIHIPGALYYATFLK